MRKQRSHIAPPISQLKRQITITHPFHPQSGEEFELAQYQRSWGREIVDCFDKDGRLVSLALAWTDAAGELDPFVAASAGQSYFRVEDLLHLAEMIERLKA